MFPLKAENFRESQSFIHLPNIEPQGMVPGSRTASVSKTDMVPASWSTVSVETGDWRGNK